MATKESCTVLVFGATGLQGGSVIRHLLKHCPSVRIRAVTRDPGSEAARSLSSCDRVQVVKADITGDLPENILKGVDTCFLVTDSYDPSLSGTKEVEHGKRVVDILSKAGISNLIFSTLPNVEKESKGKIRVPMFTNKALIEEHIRSKNFKNTVFLVPAFYYQNFQTMFPPRKDEKGNLTITLPETSRLCGVDIDELGIIVVNLLRNIEKYNGRVLCLCGQNTSPKEYIQLLEKKLGKTVHLNLLSHDEYAKRTGSRDLAEMFRWFNEFTYFGKTLECESGKELHHFRDFKTWLDESNPKFEAIA